MEVGKHGLIYNKNENTIIYSTLDLGNFRKNIKLKFVF